MEYRRNEIVSGAFVIAAVLIFAALSFRVGGIDIGSLFGGGGVPCRIYLADVKTLDTGAKVSVGGRQVGAVTGLALAERIWTEVEVARLREQLGDALPVDVAVGRARPVVAVDFALDDLSLRIDWDRARAQLVQDGFLGRHFLVLDPGSWDSSSPPPRLAERPPAAVAEIAVRESGGIDGLIATLRPTLRRVDSILGKIDDEFLSGDNIGRFGEAIEHLRTILKDVAVALDDDNPEGLRHGIVDPLAKLLSTAEGAVSEVRVRLLEQTLVKVESLLDAGPELVAGAGRVLAQTEGIVSDSRPRVARALDDVVALTSSLETRIGAIERRLGGLLDESRGALAENRPEIAETIRRLRRTMWEAEMAMRKIRANPALLLFGDDEADLSAQPIDESNALRRGRARPYGQRDERDGGGK